MRVKYSRALKKGEHQLKIFLLSRTEKEVRFAWKWISITDLLQSFPPPDFPSSCSSWLDSLKQISIDSYLLATDFEHVLNFHHFLSFTNLQRINVEGKEAHGSQ